VLACAPVTVEGCLGPGLNGGPVPIALQVLLGLVLLVLASDAFANAVEWAGALLGLTRSAVGAVVAAIGSSLPETMVVFIALVILHDAASMDVGIGAVIGAPLLLSTVVFSLIGLGAIVLGKEHAAVKAPATPTIVGLALFSLTFALVIGASFAPTSLMRTAVGTIIIALYGVYLWYHIRLATVESDETPPPLRFAPRAARPPLWIVALQLLTATVVTAIAARWFVASITSASAALHTSPLLISLLLSPIATELPEVFNSVIWMRRDLDDLALGNVIGAMMFQTSIACAIAIFASPWHLDAASYRAAVATLAAALFLLTWTAVRRKVEALPLALSGLFYCGYIVSDVVAR
jgi:cation:H+ antiporter